MKSLFRDPVNFRDLGGYTAKDGRKIKKGLLYRSGGLYLMNQEEKDLFLSLGIRFIMDLRSKEESDASPDPVFPNIEMVRHSGITYKGGEEIDFSPIGMSRIGKEGEEQLALLNGYYTSIPFDNEAYKILMDKIVHHCVPIVYHCHTGKDRTGVFTIILLLALGLDEETIFNDFMLSNYFHREALARALSDNEEKINAHPEAKELLTMWFGVSERIGHLVISIIKEKYGSYEAYFENEYGLDTSGIMALRDYYLE